jgi:outer membrane biosynthesis protein TonB
MPGRDFYLWQAHSFTAHVALDLVDSLDRALADPRHKQGQELGGVLFGRILQPENIEITNVEFIHSEHHRGTVFALGLRERGRIARQLAVMNSRSDVHPVGFFRTHLRPGLFLDQDDFAFMTEAFADPSQVALLIRPAANGGTPAAGFFIWEDGDIDRRQTLLSFPFESQKLRALGPVETKQIQPPAPLLALPNIHIPVPNIRKPMLGWSVAAVALIALLALGMQYRPAPSPPRKEVERPLNIALQRKGDAVIVDWDKRATALKQASSGVLTINDGGTTQKLNLSRTELDHGKVQFWPRSDEVTVHMDLTHQDVAGSTANLAIPRPPPETAEATPPPVPVTATPQPRPQTVSKRRQRPVPKSAPKLIAAAMPPSGLPPAPPPQPNPAVEAPPVLVPVPPPSINFHARTVAVFISVEPKQSSELKKVVSRLPLLGRSFHAEGGADYSPARPTRPLAPHVPQMIAEDLAREISVDVKVSIDKHGAVKNAQVLSGGNSMLANLAANTAETTAWEPAKQGDRTVSSDVIVHYRFSPAQ